MSKTPEYRIVPRLTKKGAAYAVIRTGPRGGQRDVVVTLQHSAACRVRRILNADAQWEV